VLYELSGDLRRAAELAEHWSDKDPLDPEALTARADLAAQHGDRNLAIRILGSVVDVRPGDVKAQKRLARLHRWAGRPAVGCRHAVAISQLRQDDEELLAEAVRCSRRTGEGRLASEMLAAATEKTRQAAERLLKDDVDDTKLSGDLQLEASWSGGDHDLDLGLLHPDGHRVSWLGAPTRSVITATDVTSKRHEGLALRGAKPGEYVIEIVRASGVGSVSGEVNVRVADQRRSIPFTLDGDRAALGVARISMHSNLVPVR
jgi:tetratricopeptide (TPR) repeat protein